MLFGHIVHHTHQENIHVIKKKRVSNSLCTSWSKSSESNVTFRLAHMTNELNVIFLETVKVMALFVIFMIASTQTLVLYQVLLAFLLNIVLSFAWFEARPTIKYLNRALSLKFLARDFPKTSHTEHIACLILSSSLLCTLAHTHCTIPGVVTQHRPWVIQIMCFC